MRKLIIPLLLLSSCTQQQISGDVPIKPDPYTHSNEGGGTSWKIQVIDSCEYLIGWGGYSMHGGPILTHRARCIYCKQRNTQKVE